MKTLSSAAVVIGALRINEWNPDKNQNVINELICTLTLPIYYSVCFFFVVCDFFRITFFRKILSGKHSECQTVWIWIRPDVLNGLICVQTICKGYQQTTLVGKELRS